jgi:DNA-directed RNA polymerase specialized sigma24 family protein
MIFRREQLAPVPEPPVERDGELETVDALYDLYDFFDQTVDDVTAYLLHRTGEPKVVHDLALDVYGQVFQRWRSLSWGKQATLQTLLGFADQVIASARIVREAELSPAYLEVVRKSLVPEVGSVALEQLQILFRLLHGLSDRDQKLATFSFFLHWSSEKIAPLLGIAAETVEQDRGTITEYLAQQLQTQSPWQGQDVRAFLASFRPTSLPEDERTALRIALLERYREKQTTLLRLLLQMAVILLVMNGLAGGAIATSVFLVPPQTLGGPLHELAAAEVLLSHRELQYLHTLRAAERELQGIASHYAERDIAAISLELASLALREQLSEQQEVNGILEEFGARLVASEESPNLLACSLPSPKPLAASP